MNSSTRSLMMLVILWCSFASGDARQLPASLRPERPQPEEQPTKVDFVNFFQQFEQFRKDYNRTYPSAAETLKRFVIFTKNLLTIADLTRTEMGTAEYGLTEMSDWTEKEFLEKRANLNPTFLQEAFNTFNTTEQAKIPEDFRAPDAFDWRDQGKVTPVKNQGQCGSCWAFSVTGNLENCYKIQNPNAGNMILSEQQLVDCDTNSSGCNGGWMSSAMNYIIRNGGLGTEASYPYEAKTGTCRSKKGGAGVQVDRNVELKSRDESNMANYIASTSSTSNAINAQLLQSYRSGIINQPASKCNNANNAVNHAVLAVGYGTQNGIPFWVIKNSWGSAWGENGYARIRRGVNACGMAHYISAGVLKK